jgi:hypothetical protein
LLINWAGSSKLLGPAGVAIQSELIQTDPLPQPALNSVLLINSHLL